MIVNLGVSVRDCFYIGIIEIGRCTPDVLGTILRAGVLGEHQHSAVSGQWAHGD